MQYVAMPKPEQQRQYAEADVTLLAEWNSRV